MHTTLAGLERYYDTAPRAASDAEEVGPFTLFRSRLTWPYYARPRLGLDRAISADDVRALLARQDELGLPRTVEWVHQTTPSLLGAARQAGLDVHEAPLLLLAEPVTASAPPGVELRLLSADDPLVPEATAVAHIAFAHRGTATGVEGVAERDAQLASKDNVARADAVRSMLRAGTSTMGMAYDTTGVLGGGVVASGSFNQRGDTSEIVGVATLPSARRRGLAAALTALLVSEMHAVGVRTVFLSADSEDVAQVYRRIGFTDVGTACIVE